MATDKKLSDFPKVVVDKSKKSGQKIMTEIGRADPSSIVTLYEIDLEQLFIDEHMSYNTRGDRSGESVFRFHNNLKLTQQVIIWRGEQYRPLPIRVEGIEQSSKGTLPTPRLQLFSDDEVEKEFREFKVMMRRLDDLIGARVTRVRTFAKYIDVENFYMVAADGTRTGLGEDSIIPEGFEPDPLAEFPREIFFINRKSVESKKALEFELASFMDFENLKLPSRLVVSRYCQFQYRGEGCLYQRYTHFSDSNFNSVKDKKEKLDSFFGCDDLPKINFPNHAIPVANENDEIFVEEDDLPDGWNGDDSNAARYDPDKGSGGSNPYAKGDIVFIVKKGIQYFFVAKVDNVPAGSVSSTAIPPNTNYWFEDKCSKTIGGCKLRWSDNFKAEKGILNNGEFSMDPTNRASEDLYGNGSTHQGCLPFGGFPAVEKLEGRG